MLTADPVRTGGTKRHVGRFHILLLVAGIATAWLLAHPYTGIRHDGRLYLGMALAQLDAQAYARDLFFAYGAQDRYTLFPRLYAVLIDLMGVPAAAKFLLLACQAAFIASAAALLRTLCRGTLFWLALAAVCCLPGGYGPRGIFAFGETFLTARNLAEPLCLAALALLVHGRTGWAALTLVGAGLMHPLIALPAVATGWLYLCLADRRWWWLAAAAPLAFVPATLGIAPFDGLLARYDAPWLAIVRSGLAFLFPSHWSNEDWMRLAYDALLVGLAWRLASGNAKRWLLAVALSAAGGVLLSVLGADLLSNVLLTSLQSWRALWLLHLAAIAALPLLVWRYWMDEPQQRLLAALLVAAWLCLRHDTALLALLAIVTLHAAGSRAAIADPRMQRLALAGIGLLALVGLADQLSVLATQDEVMRLLDARPLFAKFIVHPLVLISGFTALFLALRGGRPLAAAAGAAALLPALAVAIAAWDQRPAWERLIEDTHPAPHAFAPAIGSGEQVYWRDELLMVWLGMGRPSYYSLAQGSSLTFNRAQALELDRRGKALSKLRFQETLCGVIATVTEGQGGCVIGPAILERTCREATGLDHIVLPHRIADLASAQWDYRDPQGETRAYYLYSCRKLLAKVVPAD